MTMQHTTTSRPEPEDLISQVRLVRQEIAALNAQVTAMTRRQHRWDELVEDLSPVAKQALEAATEQLDEVERKGYFVFAREVLGVVDKVVSGYTAEDVRQLGDNVVAILDTVKNVTQPEVLALANDVTDSLHGGGARPTSLFGMLRASRDADVRMGLGVVMGVLKQIGRGARGASGTTLPPRRQRAAALAAMTAPVRKRPAGARKKATAKEAPAATACAPPLYAGTFIEDGDWNHDVAQGLAEQLGLGALTPEHWAVIDFARREYVDAGASPNVRRITLGAGVSTRDIYQLFKKAPGKTVARLAGIPKPGGCL